MSSRPQRPPLSECKVDPPSSRSAQAQAGTCTTASEYAPAELAPEPPPVYGHRLLDLQLDDLAHSARVHPGLYSVCPRTTDLRSPTRERGVPYALVPIHPGSRAAALACALSVPQASTIPECSERCRILFPWGRVYVEMAIHANSVTRE